MSHKNAPEQLEKVIDKIQKLLAMANDTSSPKEALLAAKRARVLMDKYQLSQDDIESKIGSQFLELENEPKGKLYLWEKHIALAAATLNDCRSAIRRRHRGSQFLFQGFKADVIVAKMTMDYLTHAARKAKELSEVKGISESQLFMQGFANEVLERANDIKRNREKHFVSNKGTGLVVLKMTEIIKHFGELGSARHHKARSPMSFEEMIAFELGSRAGRSISLDKQIDEKESSNLNLIVQE
ncbi:DUF2786 domain-containing protein [Vibrio fluvialis]|nr:DUF2786 domain-containing protein [Vibrio fluvialis]MBY8230284.1 DUF2786 domain-containing protein [Vibrio fluvialis]